MIQIKKAKYRNGGSCPADLQGVCRKFYNVQISPKNPGTGYAVSSFGCAPTEGKGDNLLITFSNFRTDKYPSISELSTAISSYLRTSEGQTDFCRSYLLPRIETLYSRAGLAGTRLPIMPGELARVASRFDGIKVAHNRIIPIHGMTRPGIYGYKIYVKDWYVLGHELMHVGSGLDFFPGNTLLGKLKCIFTRVADYLEGAGKSTPIGRYYGSRLWAKRSNPAAVLEEMMTSAVNTEYDPDFEGLWGSVKERLRELPRNASAGVLNRIVRSWLNLTDEATNQASQKFVMDAITGKKEP